MRVRVTFVALVCTVLASALSVSAQSGRRQTADIVFRHGAIYTLDRQKPWVDAVAVAGGKIVFAGADQDAERFIGRKTRVVELNGRMVLPGFHDSHVHPVESGMELGECVLGECKTEADIIATLKAYRLANPNLTWIRGGGWDLPIFPNANPNKSILDEIFPETPAFLAAADGHSAWVNSRALEIAGITRNTPDPESGRIERDPESGEPTGTLREAAVGLVASRLPPYSKEEYLAGARRAVRLANQFGITSLQEAHASDEILDAYAELDRRGELPVRVVAAMHVDPKGGVAQVADLKKKRERHMSGNVRFTAAKIFVDGVIEAKTAALLEPYVGDESRGTPNLTPEELSALVVALDAAGFQVHIHAIGDRAIRMALDSFESARKANGVRDSRHHIAHLELIDPVDIPRFRRLGVIANFQPLWAYADTYITQLTEPVLGPKRSRWLYPIESVLKTGAIVVGGSDWSVSSLNPLDAIQVALTRTSLQSTSDDAWIPEEKATLSDMLAAYTINGAYVNFEETQTGSITVGKAADLVVLDRNLFEIPANEIHKTKVLLTLLAGKEVYRADGF